MSKKSKKGLTVFIIILALALLLGIFQVLDFVFSGNFSQNYEIQPKEFNSKPLNPIIKFNDKGNKSTFKNQKKSYIAKLVIEGTIQSANQTYNQEWLLNTIDGLKNDPNNKGIILYIDSPGGSVYESDEAYLALMDYKKESERPIYAYMASMAASGGYYIACSADYITANRNCLTGSIGVIAGQFLDLTELMKTYGIKSETIHAGKNKNMGSFNEPLTDEQRQIMQSVADECYEQFTKIVSSSRKMEIQDVEKLADGRIYTAKQALSNGLVDYIGDFEVCQSAMDRKEFDFADYPIYTYQYEKTQNFYDMFMSVSKGISKFSKSSSNLPDCVENLIKPDLSFPAYYFDGFSSK